MVDNKPQKHAICEDVYLYTTRSQGPPISFSYEIECCKFNNLHFTMDFTGSENFELESGGLVIEKVVVPFKRAKVGTLVLKDAGKGANLKNTYSWDLREPDPRAVESVMVDSKSKINRELERAKVSEGDFFFSESGRALIPLFCRKE